MALFAGAGRRCTYTVCTYFTYLLLWRRQSQSTCSELSSDFFFFFSSFRCAVGVLYHPLSTYLITHPLLCFVSINLFPFRLIAP